MIIVVLVCLVAVGAFVAGFLFGEIRDSTTASVSARAGAVLHSGRHFCRPPRGYEPERGETDLLIMQDWPGRRPIAVDDGWVCPECGASWTAKLEYGSLAWVKDVRALGDLS